MTGSARVNGAAQKTRGHDRCAGCGERFAIKTGRAALVVPDRGLALLALVCPDCARRGVLVVAVDRGQADARSALLPFAKRFRQLAGVYSGDRGVGLEQAADLLEAGKIELVDDPEPRPAPRPRPAEPPASSPADPPARASRPRTAGALSRIERAILHVLIARAPASTTKRQAGVLARYSANSGSFSSALGKLRAAGFIQGPAERMTATVEGRSAAGPVAPLPTGSALVSHWVEHVGVMAGAILEVATAAYPGELDKDELAVRTGYSAASGSFSSALGKLRALSLLEGLRASDELMGAVSWRGGDEARE